MKKMLIISLLIGGAGVVVSVAFLYRVFFPTIERARMVFRFLRDSEAHQDLVMPGLARCGDAPFLIPTTGMIGFLWNDTFRPGHRHSGIDIFSGAGVGESPVYAAHDGYLSRLPGWKSSVIIRILSDPLNPDHQIWTYYTHLADEDGQSLIDRAFPQGASEVFVPAGTLLGYQGNYSGRPGRPTGVHLHFSIVKDDGHGNFLNELEIENTLDPSPYFGLVLNGKQIKAQIPVCLALSTFE